MTKRINVFSTILVVVVLLAGCARQTLTPAEESEVRAVVEEFGKELQFVSLQSPDAVEAIREMYSQYVSPVLLDQWISDLSQAPGRFVSSPWPDRIEITSITKTKPNEYSVTGYVVEVTSIEVYSGGAANKIPVRITLQKSQGRWLITKYAEDRVSP